MGHTTYLLFIIILTLIMDYKIITFMAPKSPETQKPKWNHHKQHPKEGRREITVILTWGFPS